ncbi:MAG: HK97 gp10 family phage protein [Proteobacteria bacterium]|nr:HK97 gp10 family phage protein [Pseudomonadota bacterium]
MASVTLKIEGLSDLGKRLQTLSADMQGKVARAATAAGAVVIKNAAIQKAPEDTGNLKKNIIAKRLPKSETSLTSEHIVTVRKGKKTAKQKAAGIRDAYYGVFVEFGTAKMTAQPFLRPAFDQNKEKAVDAMKNRLEARIKKAGA